jgi:hypothetical protein
MAPRTEAPSRRQALEELDAIEAEEELEGAEPADDTTGATPREGSEAPAEGEESAEPEAEATAEEVEAGAEGAEGPPEGQAEQEPAAWQPPPGGQPFRFQADHRVVEVPGALEWDHGVYVPREAWTGVVARHLADRDLFLQREGQYQAQIDQLNPEINPIVLQAQATVQKFMDLFEQGPQAVAKWLDNFALNRPLLEQQIQNQVLSQQLEARNALLGDTEYQAAVEQTRQALPGYLQQNIDALIDQTPAFQELKGSGEALVRQFWPFARSILWEADRNYPEYGVLQGQIVPRIEVLTQLLQQEVDRRAEVKRLQAGRRHNAAALGNGGRKPTPKTVPARGKPVPAGQRQVFKPGQTREAKEAYLDFDPLAE